jgi:hypothetical protein
MATYSYGNPPTDALKLDNINDVLSGLPDNTSKLISPKDVRDAVYTLWENVIFKQTSNGGGTEYIGVDQNNLAQKILIGKKTFGGTPVMNQNLLDSTDVDVFFYNMKTSSVDYNTTVAFLAGTGSNFQNSQLSAPYIRSRVVDNPPYKSLDFDINNSSYYFDGGTGYGGNISVKSDRGNIFLNGLRFPTFDERLGPNNGDLLKYKLVGGVPTAYWEEAVTASSDTLFSLGTVSIQGNPVVLNGLPINFSYHIPTPVAIGGIPAGSTFSNVPVTEMIRQILYPYIEPEITTSLNYSLIEIGDSVSSNLLSLSFTIYKNATYSLTNQVFTNPNPNFWYAPPGVVPPDLTLVINGLTTFSYRPLFNITTYNTGNVTFATYSFSVQISDTYPTVKSSTSSLYVVTPWYYGTATISATQNLVGLNTINSILGTSSNYTPGKLTPILQPPVFLPVTSSYNKTLNFTTAGLTVNIANQGYVYFGYPADFPPLQSIVDANGFTMTSSFESFTVSDMNSPYFPGRWNSKTYRFYIFVGSTGSTIPLPTTTGPTPSYSGDIKFNFI